MPAAIPFAYQNKSLGWNEQAGPEPHLAGQMIDEERGHVLGGSSSINAMIFNRGNPRDFEGWATQDLSGWGWKDVLPCFRKMEMFSKGAGDTRGGDGPLAVTRSQAGHPLFETFMRSGEETGYPRPADHNSGDQEGMHIAQCTIAAEERCNAARAYLRPALRRPNLTLRTVAMVTRVLVERDRATGVLLADGTRLEAAREVIAGGPARALRAGTARP